MKNPARMPSQRQLRVGEQLRHIIAETLQRGHFSHTNLIDSGQISVTEVRASPDLKHATAYVMSLGGHDMEEFLEALNEEHQIFQKEINRQSNLKFTPRVRFVTDNSFEEANKIESILNQLDLKDDE